MGRQELVREIQENLAGDNFNFRLKSRRDDRKSLMVYTMGSVQNRVEPRNGRKKNLSLIEAFLRISCLAAPLSPDRKFLSTRL